MKVLWTHVLLTSAFLAACGVKPENSTQKFRPADPNAVNVFYVVGAPNGLSGVATDVREMANVLSDESNGYNWQVQSNGNATKAEILQKLQTYSAQVGENGSLGFYVSGHGDSSGRFMTANGMLSYREVAAAIASGRATPLKRLLTFNDSCFSGHWVDGNGQLPEDKLLMAEEFADLSPEEAQENAEMAAQQMADGFMTQTGTGRADSIEQFLTFAASKKTQTSLDYGRTRGGAFTWTLRQTFANLKKSNNEATVGQFAEKTAKDTYSMTRHHLPVYRAYPASLLEEKLFEFAH